MAVRTTTNLRALTIEPIGNQTPRYTDVSGTKVVAVSDPGNLTWQIAYTDFATGLPETFSGG